MNVSIVWMLVGATNGFSGLYTGNWRVSQNISTVIGATYGMEWHGLEDDLNLLSFTFYVSRLWDLPLLASAAILSKWGCYRVVSELTVIENKGKTLTITTFLLPSIIMSTPEYIYPIIILSDSDVEDTFSSTHSPDYILALSDYSLASPGNTSPNFSDDLTKDLLSSLSISPFHDDLRILQ
ncbi:hypothetical protein Tco_0173839 [Tanacetum coccineum]